MGNVFEPDGYVLTIGGTPYTKVKIRRWNDQIGFRPSRIWALLADQTPGSILRAGLQGQPATFTLNGVLMFTGYCKTVTKSERGRTVEVLITDYRQELDSVFIGQLHLGTPNSSGQPASGLPYIGADIWFNRQGLPNLVFRRDDTETDAEEHQAGAGDDEPVEHEPVAWTKPVLAGPKTGRNDPCPCGSGKKFKKCCLNKQKTAR